MGFTAMIEEKATRPFVHRQLLPQTVKSVASIIPEQSKAKLETRLIKGAYIENRYTQANIPQQYVIEYYLMYIFCFLALFASIWVLRSLLSAIVQDKTIGTIGAMLFALIFPLLTVATLFLRDFHLTLLDFAL